MRRNMQEKEQKTHGIQFFLMNNLAIINKIIHQSVWCFDYYYFLSYRAALHRPHMRPRGTCDVSTCPSTTTEFFIRFCILRSDSSSSITNAYACICYVLWCRVWNRLKINEAKSQFAKQQRHHHTTIKDTNDDEDDSDEKDEISMKEEWHEPQGDRGCPDTHHCPPPEPQVWWCPSLERDEELKITRRRRALNSNRKPWLHIYLLSRKWKEIAFEWEL